jgi:serine/threonine protein phosphatase PrpC/CRP-like cAMP-binding protein
VRIVVSGQASVARGAVNEDAALVRTDPAVVAVADGIGGPGKGDRAAKLALSGVVDRAAVLQRLVEATHGDRSSGARLALSRTLERLFTDLHHDVQELVRTEGQDGMAVTLAVAVPDADQLHFAHVGAVRVYLYRRTSPTRGELRLLTEDHTLGALRVRHGTLTRDEYLASPLRKRLYAAIGVPGDLDVDLRSAQVGDGDRVLVCTAGVYDHLDDATIERLLVDGDAQRAADVLVREARARGLDDDDATAVVFDMGADRTAAVADEIDAVLRTNRLFRDLTGPERAVVAPYLDERLLPPAGVLFREGDPGDGFFVVAHGTLRVTRSGTPLTDVGPGGSLGELCLARDVPRSATTYAAGPSLVFGLTRARFAEILVRRPAVAAKVLLAALDGVGDRLREVSDRLSAVEKLAMNTSPSEDALREAIVRAARGTR